MKYLAIASVAAALGLSVGAVQAQSSTAAKPAATKNAPAKTAAKKPASKTASKGKVPAKTAAAVEANTPVEPLNNRLSDAELQIARGIHTGRIQCELGASVTMTEDGNNPGFFNVVSGKERYYMHPVESRTGAVRLEDPRAGAVWLQLGNKSMLMNQRKGERVADDCKTSQQNDVAEAMKREPQGKSMLGN